MKIKLCLIIGIFILPVFVTAQTKVNAQWTKLYGGTNFENPVYPLTNEEPKVLMIRDDQDNLYIATTTFSNDIDVNAYYGFIDTWILKLNSQGDTLWTLVLGGTDDDIPKDIITDGNGGCIVVGHTFSDDGVFLNTGHHGDKSREDGFVAFIDKDGKLSTLKQFGSKAQISLDTDGNTTETGGHDGLEAIVATKDGNYMCVGYSNSYTDDLGPLDVTQYWAGWFLKITPTGKKISSKKISHEMEEPWFYTMKLYDLYEEPDGNFVAYGEVAFMMTNFFWSVKTDGVDNTNKIWDETYTGETMQGFGGMTRKKDGNFAVCNYVIGSAGDNTGIPKGYGDVWLFEIDKQDGTILNQRMYGGSNGDLPYGLTTTESGNLILSGKSSSTDGDAFGGYGGNDFWMLEIDQNTLDTLRMHKFGGSAYDALYSAVESKDNNSFYVAGFSESNDPADFGYVHGNKGATDIYVAKIEADPTISVENISSKEQTLKCIPTSEKNNFNLLNCKNSTIYIYDILGKEVMTKSVNSDIENINLQNMEKGVYIVRNNDLKINSCKIVVD